MNVLIYAHAFAPSIGGVEMNVMHLARGLAGTGSWDVTLATQTPPGAFDDAILPFRVVRKPSLVALWNLVRAADVIHLAGPVLLPLALALVARKPVVVKHHGYQAVCPNGLLLYEPTKTVCPGHFMARRYWRCLRCNAHGHSWLASLRMLALTFLRRWLCHRASCHVAVTDHVKGRVRLPRTRTIYHGVPAPDTALSAEARVGVQAQGVASRSADTQCSHGACFAYVGRLVSEKGLPTLLRAAALLRDEGYPVRLKFVGDGPERAALSRLAQALGLQDQVTFTGFLQGDALEAALGDVVALVMPSMWEETAGLAAIEQMMRGRLVIAADIGGLGEVVGAAGLTFPPGDERALAACLGRAVREPDLADQLEAEGRARAEQLFRVERVVGDHLRLYRELLQ